MPDMPNVAFRDIKPDDFPFTIEYLSTETDDVLHTTTVDGPGSVQIPGRDTLGAPVDVRITWPDGRWVRSNLDGTDTHGPA